MERTFKELSSRMQRAVRKNRNHDILIWIFGLIIIAFLCVGPCLDLAYGFEPNEINPFVFEKLSRDEHLNEVEAYISFFHANVKERFKTKALAHAPAIVDKSSDNMIDPLFIATRIARESTFKHNTIGKIGEVGLMQVKCCWGQCKGLDMRIPDDQIQAGINHIYNGLGTCGNVRDALNKYCTGTCTAKKTPELVKDILEDYAKAIDLFRIK